MGLSLPKSNLIFKKKCLDKWVHFTWGPLAQHRLKEVIEHPVVKEIALKYGKEPVQIALRHHVQRGIVVIPKSIHKDRMKQNLDIFDFKLFDEDMEQLKKLDENKSMWAEYDDPMIVQYAMEE